MSRSALTVLVACLAAAPALAEYPELAALKEFSLKALASHGKRLSGVDKKFEGVVNFGKSLAALPQAEAINVADLTCRSKDYWRAALEMAPTDPSVLFAHAHLHVARGEIPYADAYFMFGALGMGKELQGELLAYQGLAAKLRQRVEAEMKKGIAAHDEGRFDEALKAYDAVIAEYPACAWAYYEKGYAYLAMGVDNPEHEPKRSKMYQESRRHDPFYWQAYQGSDPVVIRNLLVLGQKVDPFASGKKRTLETFTQFAEGCEEMELYPFAAHARWLLVALDSRNIATHLRRFLDLLEKCGCADAAFFRAQFKLDNPAPADGPAKEAGPR